ncbi:MAG: pantoate--beta-alanine ligase [Legionellales bacterium]|nr:pantoate--beta-alanine ligase [Legionellales bacterium]|tara:strand:+ start:1081 stop:1917 length:837 start_codon:yes stop_codon:yes gene_type:complete
MEYFTEKSALQFKLNEWRKDGYQIAFVPTMGALHNGHLSLVKHAQSIADKVVVSIFVNPKQFAPHEDFSAYPRIEQEDCQQLAAQFVDAVYLPSENQMYPDTKPTVIDLGPIAEMLEGVHRPHFFPGVANVVLRLFDHVQPDMAIFGEKDYQQLCVISSLVKKQKITTRIIPSPTIRDAYGLALSSRNRYLSLEQTSVARLLNQVLFSTAKNILNAPNTTSTIINQSIQRLLKSGFSSVEYLALKRADDLSDYVVGEPGRLLIAAKIETTRLIDNVPV